MNDEKIRIANFRLRPVGLGGPRRQTMQTIPLRVLALATIPIWLACASSNNNPGVDGAGGKGGSGGGTGGSVTTGTGGDGGHRTPPRGDRGGRTPGTGGAR